MEEPIPLYVYWVVGFVVAAINVFWMQRLQLSFLSKAGWNAAGTAILLVIMNAIAAGAVSNLFPIAMVMYGVPIFLFSCTCQAIILLMAKKK